MKSVGQQLKEARLAKDWTPELAARETKIKADRVRDLEADDYANFSSPTYARGFVRTYARALGLDEYRILRQLDNKLPEDDNASFAPDNGSMPYVPEPATQALHVSSAPRTGLYVVFGMGCAVVLVIAFVLLQAYRAGELQRYFASTSTLDSASTNSATAANTQDSDVPQHALPVDPNDTTHSVRAQPVDLNADNTSPATAPGGATNSVAVIPVAQPVNPPDTRIPATATDPTTATTHVSSPEKESVAPQIGTSLTPPITVPAAKADTPASDSSTEIHGAKPPPRALPVDPSDLVAINQASPEGPINPADAVATGPTTPGPGTTTAVDLGTGASPVAVPVDAHTKRLVLTASHDSFIRVTSLDNSANKAVLYASVLRSGQSLEFEGRKFSLNVAVPSAVAIMLDGVNYGPHSDGGSPETFTLESHQP